LDTKVADQTFGDNSAVFFMTEPIVLPSDVYEWHISIPHATITPSHWMINEENNLLHLEFAEEDRFIALPLSNRSVDELIIYLNDGRLLDGFEASYDDAINLLVIASSDPDATLAVGDLTTCDKLLGLCPSDASVDGVLVGGRSVDLSGTSSIFIRSNLSTRNRDPVTRAQSNVLANVHVSRNFNAIEYHSSGMQFAISDRFVSVILVYLTDDERKSMDFHNVDYSHTIEFALKRKERIAHVVDYRLCGVMFNKN
jgi:hypothetical protein